MLRHVAAGALLLGLSVASAYELELAARDVCYDPTVTSDKSEIACVVVPATANKFVRALRFNLVVSNVGDADLDIPQTTPLNTPNVNVTVRTTYDDAPFDISQDVLVRDANMSEVDALGISANNSVVLARGNASNDEGCFLVPLEAGPGNAEYNVEVLFGVGTPFFTTADLVLQPLSTGSYPVCPNSSGTPASIFVLVGSIIFICCTCLFCYAFGKGVRKMCGCGRDPNLPSTSREPLVETPLPTAARRRTPFQVTLFEV